MLPVMSVVRAESKSRRACLPIGAAGEASGQGRTGHRTGAIGPFRCPTPATHYCGMTVSTSVLENGSRRHPVRLDRVECWRLGPGELERCRECVYLLRLERATAHGSAVSHVVCVDDDRDLEAPFSW